MTQLGDNSPLESNNVTPLGRELQDVARSPLDHEPTLPELPTETDRASYIAAMERHLDFSKGLSKQECQLLHLVEIDEVGYEAAGLALGMTLEDVKHTMLNLRLRRNAIVHPD